MGDKEQQELGEVTIGVQLQPLDKGPETIYANFMQVNHTPWDFTLHFGHFVLPTEPVKSVQKIEAKTVARITVPITLMRGIVRAL